MAMNDTRRGSFFWSRLHFLIRLLGVTGLLVACVGLVLDRHQKLFPSWEAAIERGQELIGGASEPLAVYLVLLGGLAAAVALLVELLVVLGGSAAGRSFFGLNALVQIGLAAFALGAINYFSFGHHARFDWTRQGDFTLPPAVADELRKLTDMTTLVVYQQHKSFGNLTDKPDRYDYAAERKVVEKVKDLVEQVRDLGPQFEVRVLDVEEEGFDQHLDALTKDKPELKKAIEEAPENSIFFCAGGKVRRLSFNEFYQLDKVKSKGESNLVLLAQGGGSSGRGVETFANALTTLGRKKPRIGILVVHEYLTTEGPIEEINLRGLRKTLETHGFEVRDVVLRKDVEGEPVADTVEERKLQRLDDEIASLEDDVKMEAEQVEVYGERVADWKRPEGKPLRQHLNQLAERYPRAFANVPTEQSEAFWRRQLAFYEDQQALWKRQLSQDREELDDKRKDRAKIDQEQVAEKLRQSDVGPKLRRNVLDCDLLLIPRLTRMTDGQVIYGRLTALHELTPEQARAVQDFVAQGKPLLACLGPMNEQPRGGQFPGAPPMPPQPVEPDPLDRMLAKLGVIPGKQTVLVRADQREFAGRQRGGGLGGPATFKGILLRFDDPTDTLQDLGGVPGPAASAANPLREGMRVTSHSVGDQFDLRLRFARPVWFDRHRQRGAEMLAGPALRLAEPPLPFDPTFLVIPEGWNEEQPFVVGGKSPRFTEAPSNDPRRGTRDEPRMGAFPVGVAVEVPVPSSWTDGDPRTTRVAVLGQADLIYGRDLGPAKERLVLQTLNWLLGHDEYLPRADRPWNYPRIAMPDEDEKSLWLWGTRLGLPVLFAYLGFVVLLIRRLR